MKGDHGSAMVSFLFRLSSYKMFRFCAIHATIFVNVVVARRYKE
jgi:hypothetical protein